MKWPWTPVTECPTCRQHKATSDILASDNSRMREHVTQLTASHEAELQRREVEYAGKLVAAQPTGSTVLSCEHCQTTEATALKVRDENIRLRHHTAQLKDEHAQALRVKDAEQAGIVTAHLREQATMHEHEIARHQEEIRSLRTQIAKLR